MKASPPAVIGLALLSGGLVFLGVNEWLLREGPLASDPHLPRPWAEKRFRELAVKPVPSSASPRDPRFVAACGPLVRTGRGWETTIDVPRDEFVPDFEFVEGDAAEGFEAKDFRGRVKCLAGNYFAPDLSGAHRAPDLLVYRPDGSLLGKAEQEALGITRDDRYSTCGWREGSTSLVVGIELDGCKKPEVRNRGFLDARTGVVLGDNPQEHVHERGFCVSDSVRVLHDADLLAVVDIAHGETRDVILPLKIGEVVDDPEFRLELLETTSGNICGSSSNFENPKRIVRTYDVPDADPEPSFSVIYQIDPPVMEAAVTVEALDARGEPLEPLGRFMDLVPASRFKGNLADAVSLRVRCRTKMTRLVLRIGGNPCAEAGNRAPFDLFDVRSADISFRDSFHMRSFISETAELELVPSRSDDRGAVFPIVMKQPTVREVAELYRRLPGNRKVEVDPVAMTVEFESPRMVSQWKKITDWLRGMGLLP